MLPGILLISLAILADARIIHSGGGKAKNEEREVCVTQECLEFAEGIKNSMNISVDPCVDFYEFSCGNWPRLHPIPTGKNAWKVPIMIAEVNKRKIEKMLESDSQDDEIPPVKIVKRWYKACVDTDTIEKRAMEPLINILNGIGGWPIIMGENQWNESAFGWQVIDDYYAKFTGSNLFHDTRVAVLGENSSVFTAVLDVPGMPPATWLLNTEVDEEENDSSTESGDSEETFNVRKKFNKDGKYWKFISTILTTMAKAVGFPIEEKKFEEDIEELLNFQWHLDKLTYLMDDSTNMSISEFQQWYDNLETNKNKEKVDWSGKIINIFKDAKVDVDVGTVLKVASPEYFKKLSVLLNQTSSRTIASYLHWHFVSTRISRTTEEMRKLYEITTTDSDDETQEEKRSEKCIEEAKMTDVIAYEYIRKFFATETLSMASDAMDDIAKEIEIQIQGSNWASDEIKNLALRKLRNIHRNIGAPDWYKNETIMKHYFDGLTIESKYFENSLNLERYYQLKELRSLKYVDPIKPWIVDPLTINAFYENDGNAITVTAAMLQKPFFTSAQPNTINYALTGFLLAHEMNHPFDEQRHIFNEHGKEIEWPEEMAKRYNESIQCFVQQFDNYTLDGTPNGPKIQNYGNQTLEENMSDSMGLLGAFKAYKRREKINGKIESALPGLEMFNNDQLFFLSFANVWCENVKPDYLMTLARLDMHSTGRLRAIGSLSNSRDFAETFNCPLGSRMNPRKKCNIWEKYSDDRRGWMNEKVYRAYQI